MREVKVSTTKNLMVFMTDVLDHVTGKTGLTLSISASKDGSSFSTITPTVTERGYGWYNIALTSSHLDTIGDLVLHITSTGADPTDLILQVIYHTPFGIKKNTAYNNLMFLMVDSTNHYAPKTGLTGFTATRSIDGGSFASCSNSVSEVGNGMYKINLSASDLNGDIITLKFSATGADDRLITIVTEP